MQFSLPNTYTVKLALQTTIQKDYLATLGPPLFFYTENVPVILNWSTEGGEVDPLTQVGSGLLTPTITTRWSLKTGCTIQHVM